MDDWEAALALTQPETVAPLKTAGWAPDRKVDPRAAIAALAGEGFAFSPAACAFLTRFHGLRVAPPKTGRDGPSPFNFDVLSAAGGELDRWHEWTVDSGLALSPIGEVGDWLLSIDAAARLYLGDVGLERIGDDFAEGMAWLCCRAPVKLTRVG